MSITGAGVTKHAPNRENAVKFLAHLSSEQAQAYFSAGNAKYPAVPGTPLAERGARLGHFNEDSINLDILGKRQAEAQRF